MKQLKIFGLLLIVSLIACTKKETVQSFQGSNLVFEELANVWDEAMPLGNGMVGNLVWQKNGKLRFSLDRADLWDLRPMENIDFDTWKFQEVYEHWKADEYQKVQEVFDAPYNKLPAPSKIPAGALEFDIEKLGKVKKVELDIQAAICIVEWENGAKLTTFVHADKPAGWYRFENIPEALKIELIAPAYNRENTEGYTSQSRQDLNRLGYEQGEIINGENEITYNQKGWGEFAYQIHTEWTDDANSLIGCWSVSSENEGWEASPKAIEVVKNEIASGYKEAVTSHNKWWQNFWNQSSVNIPDSVLQRQYYLEMYKFGSVARADAPPISLQAVWTADHGKLPPWKGDYHHDLNTQLSYWPAYTGNHLQLEEGYINWLWKYRPTFKKYTREYFGVNGMNVPGVCTLDGEPMGGWIQYAMGQGVGSWLSHHFYLHWKYTMDRDFLKTKAYPWLKDVATFIDEISVVGADGKRKLKISSSPEIYNNSAKAWFGKTTNFDLALIRWNLTKAAELATELGLNEEAKKWMGILAEWPELAVDEETGLMIAPEFPYNESHRHFSHLMGFHPLGLIDYSNGENDKKIIDNTLSNLEQQSSDYWVGYSFSWQGNLYARAFDGEKAAQALTTFAECFCLKNSFHANGDQCKAGHSKFTYRPFTLEGNFAFASAIQEMLIQSHTGVINLFPALPDSWANCSFEKLRTNGAFLVSAKYENSEVTEVIIEATVKGTATVKYPFSTQTYLVNGKVQQHSGDPLLNLDMEEGEKLILKIQ
ncbi:glycosyl hydrolase family 95 catalytic domain-containing protein [Draconibacterium sp. IB214405]|uniref:glycosyl hydrolase family 95 catalytic domain-containing protein n=1 Tax=Draconibacterium sp. IB214405 TaxID=3097352 RepID=UPI002A2487BC|nr:glycoside hydrolase N-terminal domain-containing protein [Draconibacterium sp. IB214405]